jgi:hypothetical protein
MSNPRGGVRALLVNHCEIVESIAHFTDVTAVATMPSIPARSDSVLSDGIAACDMVFQHVTEHNTKGFMVAV